jgi:hypothetical protein
MSIDTYDEPDAIGYAMRYNRSHDVLIRVYDAAGNNVIETHERKGDFKEWRDGQTHHVFNPLQPGFAFFPNSAF